MGELKNVVNLAIHQNRDTLFGLSPLITPLGPNLASLLLSGIVTINKDVIINYYTCFKKLTIFYSIAECDVQSFNPKSAHFRNVNILKLLEKFRAICFQHYTSPLYASERTGRQEIGANDW
jgi:hypothetical protein